MAVLIHKRREDGGEGGDSVGKTPDTTFAFCCVRVVRCSFSPVQCSCPWFLPACLDCLCPPRGRRYGCLGSRNFRGRVLLRESRPGESWLHWGKAGSRRVRLTRAAWRERRSWARRRPPCLCCQAGTSFRRGHWPISGSFTAEGAARKVERPRAPRFFCTRSGGDGHRRVPVGRCNAEADGARRAKSLGTSTQLVRWPGGGVPVVGCGVA